jgi:hypothetical protein
MSGPLRRLEAKGLAASRPDLMRDLARSQAVIVDLDGTRSRLRTDCLGHAAVSVGDRPRPPGSAPRARRRDAAP